MGTQVVGGSPQSQAEKIGSDSLDTFTQEELEFAKSQALLTEGVETPIFKTVKKEHKIHWFTFGKSIPTTKSQETELQELVAKLNSSFSLMKDVDHSVIEKIQREQSKKKSKKELQAIKKLKNQQRELKKLITQKTKEISLKIMTSPTILTDIEDGRWNGKQNFVMLPPIADSEKQAKRLMALK